MIHTKYTTAINMGKIQQTMSRREKINRISKRELVKQRRSLLESVLDQKLQVSTKHSQPSTWISDNYHKYFI